jgi:pimeloyl-ACP methyl ester carboxylesterase
MKTGAPRALGAALDRYRLATSAPRTAWGFQSRWATVRGVATHDRASLASPDDTMPLVLVHGLAASHRYLMPLAARLAGHHPVHVIDLPGFGLSGDPGRVLDVAEHADHLADWLEAAGLTRVAVLGNSFGCQVAVDLAVRHPDRVCGLVLIGPTMDPSARTATRQILRWLGDTPGKTRCNYRSWFATSATLGHAGSPRPWHMLFAIRSRATCRRSRCRS